MTSTVSWRDFCKRADPEREAREWIAQCVLDLRRDGLNAEASIAETADILGIAARRVHSLFYAQPCAVRATLLEQIRVGVVRHKRRRMARMQRELAIMEMEIRQMEAAIALAHPRNPGLGPHE